MEYTVFSIGWLRGDEGQVQAVILDYGSTTFLWSIGPPGDTNGPSTNQYIIISHLLIEVHSYEQ